MRSDRCCIMCILQLVCIAPTYAVYGCNDQQSIRASSHPRCPTGVHPSLQNCQKVRNNINQLEQATTCKIRIVRRLLDKHLHEIACRHFFLNPIFAGSVDPSQLLFDRAQGGLGEHAQVNLRSVVSMTSIDLSLLDSPGCEFVKSDFYTELTIFRFSSSHSTSGS